MIEVDKKLENIDKKIDKLTEVVSAGETRYELLKYDVNHVADRTRHNEGKISDIETKFNKHTNDQNMLIAKVSGALSVIFFIIQLIITKFF